MILNQKALKRTLKIKISLIRNVIIPLASSLVMATTVLILEKPSDVFVTLSGGGYIIKSCITLFIIAVGGFVYLYLMILLGGIKKNDLDSISGRIYGLLPRFLRKLMK